MKFTLVSQMLADEIAEREKERADFEKIIDDLKTRGRAELDAITTALAALTVVVETIRKNDKSAELAKAVDRLEKKLAAVKETKPPTEITFDIRRNELGDAVQVTART